MDKCNNELNQKVTRNLLEGFFLSSLTLAHFEILQEELKSVAGKRNV